MRGGWAFAHWRVIFWLLTLYGVVCIVSVWKVLPETLPEDRRTRLSFVGQAARYLMIVRERTFLTHAVMGGCGTFCMFAYLSGCSPVFEDGFGFERYVDYALDVPMYFVYRNGKYINVSGKSFRDFMAGRIPELKGIEPSMSDWADHLTTIFPEVRMKQFLEMRGADGGGWRRICGLPALWVGLYYDQVALDAA